MNESAGAVWMAAAAARRGVGQLLNVVRAIAEALPVLGLSTEQAEQVRCDLRTIEGELVTEQPDRNLIKTLMVRAVAALGTATTSALASLLTASVGELMRRAGIPLG